MGWLAWAVLAWLDCTGWAGLGWLERAGWARLADLGGLAGLGDVAGLGWWLGRAALAGLV